ncbi:hypothetical protein [Actinomadura sp. HBU206391]|uniref:hypothetical protein n=1 Tax=Actinomadura sp. HBU206391 TaxID=2731692 RepID=UPI0016502112|nr:hypothetical protein [Actinomadura sp. HBU206391]MBC6459331.1 hypothetical protein [Actinomadura sp. HBU206391]
MGRTEQARANLPDDAAMPVDEGDALDQALRRVDQEQAYRTTHPEAKPTVRYECTSWSSGTVRS